MWLCLRVSEYDAIVGFVCHAGLEPCGQRSLCGLGVAPGRQHGVGCLPTARSSSVMLDESPDRSPSIAGRVASELPVHRVAFAAYVAFRAADSGPSRNGGVACVRPPPIATSLTRCDDLTDQGVPGSRDQSVRSASVVSVYYLQSVG